MTERERGTIAIIGAGLGGLAAALALQHSGWRVRLYEQAETLGEAGAGITISTGSGRALATLGLEPALLAASMPTTSVAFVHYRTGALLAGAFDHGAPVDRGFDTGRHIHRADLHSILLQAVTARDGDAVHTGSRLQSLEQTGADVTARFSNGRTATADLLIGADGARSAVRRALFDDGAPHFANQIAFRCLIPAARSAPFMSAGRAVVSVGPGRNFHRYPIRDGAIVNVIGIVQSETWQQEGWSTPATIEEFLGQFEGFHEDVLGLIACSPADTLIKWGLFVREPLARWSTGRIAVLGDAAHPILPFLGLGAALAMEDGFILARALAALPTHEQALAAYQTTRLARVERARLRTIQQSQIIQTADPDRNAAMMAPSETDPDLFSYDAATVPLVRAAGA